MVEDLVEDRKNAREAKNERLKIEKENDKKLKEMQYKSSPEFTEQLKVAHEHQASVAAGLRENERFAMEKKEETKQAKIALKQEKAKAKKEIGVAHEQYLASDNCTEQKRLDIEQKKNRNEAIQNVIAEQIQAGKDKKVALEETKRAVIEAESAKEVAHEKALCSPEYTKQILEHEKTERAKVLEAENTKREAVLQQEETARVRITETEQTERLRIEKQAEVINKVLDFTDSQLTNTREAIGDDKQRVYVLYEKETSELKIRRQEIFDRLIDEKDFNKRSILEDEIQKIDDKLLDLERNFENEKLTLNERDKNLDLNINKTPSDSVKKIANPLKAIGSRIKLLGGK